MKPNEIIVVTGLPRSGTTLLTRMLEAGGIPIYYDQAKPLTWTENGQDVINYNRILRETDKILGLEAGDDAWFSECEGMAVKVLTPSKVTIPPGHKCKFIYMDRNRRSMVNSLRKAFFRGLTRDFPESLPRGVLFEHLSRAKRDSLKALRAYPDSTTIVVRFEDVISKPKAVALRVARFVDEHMDIDAMARVVIRRPACCLPVMLEETIYVSQPQAT